MFWGFFLYFSFFGLYFLICTNRAKLTCGKVRPFLKLSESPSGGEIPSLQPWARMWKVSGRENTFNCPSNSPSRETPTLAEEAELSGFGACAVLLLSAVIYQ